MSTKGHQSAAPTEAGLKSKMVSACTGAVITSLLMTPFDVVKTRQQSQTLVRADPLVPAVREWRAVHYWVPRNARSLVDSALYSHFAEQSSKELVEAMSSRTAGRRELASLCFCADTPLTSCNSRVGAGNVAETWSRLYRDMIVLPQGAQKRLWQQMVAAGYLVEPATGRASADTRIRGTLAGMRHIARTEGLRTLWRGLSPTLVASGPSTVIYFVGYDYLRQWMGKQMRKHDALATYEKYASLFAGCIARTAAASAISPIELVRTRMQSSATHDFATVMRGISTEINNGGLRTLWRGLVPTLWRDVPFSAVYWFGYEQWKERVYEPMFATMDVPLGASYGELKSDVLARLATAFCSGASSGIVAATLTNPFDVAKTRRQIERHASPKSNTVQHTTLTQVVRHIVATEGVRGLYAGLAPRLMKVAPSCAIMISSYELGKSLFEK
ncbi:Carrier protein, mitochondrial [Coemansia sp. RSA 922]|nr:Carrier protein, mitochondrial [Coemansia sp. S17]KAJ2034821.1 Carrier protein, mitochondrial [Coemansia sp. S3946]KAJ2047794.1 Carrier protein, mitochondrial [Coemansia sp. S16]KAJ2068197.1 Carrier protein, mitochondrial [Coemansia sp. S2]KAJ2070123.1 Carrier protein, mitochondrial [Coemansia sp. S155-1]KAJ2098810.1 Carrier protein, mitochondrial [Coemansia sp. S100]KAJ2113962.1 Carrier protein, mitochondrial [Coemansia sp. RSA 922]